MVSADLGVFTEGFTVWRRALAGAEGDKRVPVFANAANEVATYVSKGLSRAVAADELVEMATAYGLDDVDAVQIIISRAFEQIEIVPDIEEQQTNGHDKDAPTISQPLFPYQPRLFSEIPKRQWLHARHYVRRHVVMTVAPGGYGKSSLLLANALELVTGRGIIGPQPIERVRCCYWNAEEPETDEIERRIAALCIAHGIKADELKGELFLGPKIASDEWRFATTDRFGKIIRNEVLINLVIEYLGDHHIGCLMLDPMVQFHHLPEIDTTCMEYLVKDIFQPI